MRVCVLVHIKSRTNKREWASNGLYQRESTIFITKSRSFQSICPVDVDVVDEPWKCAGKSCMILSMQIGHWNLYHFEYDYLIRLSKTPHKLL